MNPTRSRGIILNKIKQALSKKKIDLQEPNFSSPVFTRSAEKDLSILFAENLVKTQAEFIFCESKEDFFSSLKVLLKKKGLKQIFIWEENLHSLVREANISFSKDDKKFDKSEAGITTCDFLLARTGSILLSSQSRSGRRLSIFPPVHIVIAYTSQIVYDMEDVFAFLRKKKEQRLPSMISLVTGPSRTTDIEKQMVTGAHGPKELILFLIDDTPHG
jgi:L-lactate dehydrogenase complex protein LldG